MSIPNEITAKIIGDIISKGMNLCDVDIKKRINSAALDELCAIENILGCRESPEEKLSKIEKIIKNS